MRESDAARAWPELGDMPDEEFRAALHAVADWVADYRARIGELKITPDVRHGEITASLDASLPDGPTSFTEILTDFQTQIMRGIVHWGHPAFLGYFGSTTTAAGILGEMLAAALNVSAMTWRTSPAATELESVVLEWLRRMLGLPDDFTGIVYDTASVGVLHALAAAREGLGIDARAEGLSGRGDVPRLRVYASEQAHSSVEKAAIMLGVGERNVRRVACDAAFRLDVRALRREIERDVREGYRPLAVVATAGTTSTTSIDALEEIAALCTEREIWLHVDAAYGGALALLPECRQLLRGMERADSVVVNPHKWLFVPLDFSALYVRRPELLRATFSLVPEYLRGDAEQAERNYMDYGIQLGRRFRALKAWMVFRNFGREGLAARIREQIRLARLFASWLDADARFEILAPVAMAVVCFRAKRQTRSDEGEPAPARSKDKSESAFIESEDEREKDNDESALTDEGEKDSSEPALRFEDASALTDEDSNDDGGENGLAETNEFNRRLLENLNATAEVYLTHTLLRGRLAIRLAVGNVLTTEQHLARVYQLIRDEAARMDAASQQSADAASRQ
ncbi:MAG TPA: pyridoxal-dependent decarboxylase [Pyrinomonadaceae bacterium]|jgi:aromatic-L-amino-acid decarboxylase|nr:pyridoxal-dependent decarboxylase [Pyrinomonadaceae bacterium]